MAISKTGQALLLHKYAARWHDFVGKLSDASIARLKAKDLVKPLEDYIAGICRGNESIIRRAGFTATDLHGSRPSLNPWFSARTDLKNRVIHNDIGYAPLKWLHSLDDPLSRELYGQQQALSHALTTRHEANEAMSFFKAEQAFKRNPHKAAKRMLKNYLECGPEKEVAKLRQSPAAREAWIESQMREPDLSLLPKRTGTLVEQGTNPSAFSFRDPEGPKHFSVDVLLKDRKLLDRIPHQFSPAITFERGLRKGTGETYMLDSLGGLGNPKVNPNPLERFGKRNERELRKNWGKELKEQEYDPNDFDSLFGGPPLLKPVYGSKPGVSL